MNKYILSVLLSLTVTLPVLAAKPLGRVEQARPAHRQQAKTSSFFELSVDGGWSSIGYSLNSPQPTLTASQRGSYLYGAHLAYGLKLNRHFGLSLGADVHRYGGTAALDGALIWNKVKDTDGELYNHITKVYSLQDKQEAIFIEVPLALNFYVPLQEDLNLHFQLGARYAMPIASSASYKGDLEHIGDYSPWNLTLQQNVPGHGFYREPAFSGSYKMQVKSEVFAFAKVGLDKAFSQHVEGFVNATFNYGVLGAVRTGGTTDLGFRNDRPDQHTNHHFMSDYHGLLQTNVASSSARPLSVGVELGIRFLIPHKPQKICFCEQMTWTRR